MKRILLFADGFRIPTNQRKRSRGLRIGWNSIFTGKAFSYMLLFVLLLFSNKNYGQCSTYPSGTSQNGSAYTFCIDNSNTISVANLRNGQYVILNVVRGFTYTFQIGDVFTNGLTAENLTLFDASNDSYIFGGSASNGFTISNWVSPISGQIKVLLSRGSCVTTDATGGTLTMTLTGVNNTLDNQLSAGTDSWIGHVYNLGGLQGYAGYYTESENFGLQEFGGSYACFPLLANGVNRTKIYTETFAVRYRMRSTRPAGCYLITIRGDDGTRLYVNGASVAALDQWTDHSVTTYANVIVNFPTNSTDLVFDYYENTVDNRVSFSIVPYNQASNTITPLLTQVCSGVATTIRGSYDSDDNAGTTPNTNSSFTFSWERNTNGAGWTTISGATGLDYSPPAITTTTNNVVTQYRRTATPVNASCSATVSDPVTITTSPAVPGTPGTITGTAAQCPAVTGQVYSIAAVTNALSYTWSVPTGWSITSGQGTTSITVTTGAAGQNGNVSVTATNGCGPSAARTLAVTVSSSSVGGSISGSSSVCTGTNSTSLTLSGHTGSILRWESSIDNFATAGVAIANTSTNYVATNLTATTYYRAVVQNAGCNIVNSSIATITIKNPVATGVTICQGATSVPLTASASCVAVAQTPQVATGTGGTSESITYGGSGNTNITIDFPALPAGAIVTNTTTTITYTSNYNSWFSYSWLSDLRIEVTPPVTVGGLVSDLQTSTSSTSGTLTNQSFGSWGTGSPVGSWLFKFREYFNDTGVNPDANIANVTITVAYTLPGTLDWFTTASGGTKIYSGSSFDPVGVAGSGLTNTNTSGTTSYYVACSDDTTCRTRVDYVITPAFTAPTVETITNVTCSSTTGSVVLSGLQNGWIITQSGTATGSYTSSGTSYTVTGLAVGNYNFTVNNGTCTSSPTPNVPITDASSTTWNGSSWSYGTPDASKNIIIASSSGAPFAANLTGCALTINNGVTATVPSGVTLTITNAVTTNGQLIFENNASLVQTTNVTNTGAIEYRRKSAAMKNFDYTYWSSPVSGPTVESPVLGQTAKLLSPNTLADKYFRFDGDVAVNDWVFDDGVMTPGVGFIIRVPKPGTTYPNGENWNTPTYSQPVAFKGTPNNGNYFFTVDAGEFNLIGNPYPSAIDADLFITNPNNATMINGALYFWTHNTAITNNEYTADDYASYTLTGGTGTGVGVGNFVPEWVDANSNQIVDSGEFTDRNGNGFLDKLPEWVDANNNNVFESGEWNDVNNNNKLDLPTFEVTSNRPLGKIAAGQSFFVENSIAGSFQFTNAMRVTGNNSQFFKQANTKKTATVEKNRVWLNLTNSGGAFKQLLVGYITGATNDWDNLYDGPSFDGQEFVDFYSVNQGKNLTIQGRALPFVDTDVVPLGYRSTIAGSFDISIDNRDGSLAGQAIWLEDKKTNTLHELSKGKYTFTAINGVENDRFVLKYTGKTLGTDDNEVADKSLIVSVKNKKITLTSSAEAITQVQLFDLLGRKVYDKSKINAQEWSISNLSSSEQTLIVKTTLANGAVSNKKIIY